MDGDLPTVRLGPYFDTRYSLGLSFQWCRFEVNQHPVAEVMPVLLKSGQSASREEAVEEMKDCRSMKQHWSYSSPLSSRTRIKVATMSRGSVSIDVRTEVSIDVGWRSRSTGDECLRSTVVSEYQSTGLVPGSTMVDENRATNKCCCRSMRSTLLCG
ncbi:hypothetical protein DY000_02021864 [Brassica cretica]|uniref:Uncharacterized protein n=1 Tax=Brassica cretica TaxID=69181 RepID=A0ABQ7E5C1_BRACR|nr:hypothetical protein DY000_02021864 [Brassica cretica]